MRKLVHIRPVGNEFGKAVAADEPNIQHKATNLDDALKSIRNRARLTPTLRTSGIEKALTDWPGLTVISRAGRHW